MAPSVGAFFILFCYNPYMILASHSIIGVATARLVPTNPLLGFFLAFLSHFLADMIPHWEYKLSKSVDPKYSEGMRLNRDFFIDSMKVGSDILSGALLSYYIFIDAPIEVVAMGVMGGVLPDIMQFLYGKIKIEPLIFFKKLHDAIHSEKMDDKMLFGVITQIVTVFIVIFIYYWLIS